MDGTSKTNDQYLSGRTESFKVVNFKGSKEIIGEIIDVKVTSGKTFSLDGEIV